MQSLIDRARELVKLREKATPGPWIVRDSAPYDVCSADQGGVADVSPGKEMVSHTVCSADAKLIAAAPEMAELLQQMADELEARDRWAREMCREFCKDLETRGRHSSNCPVADWRLN